MHSEKEVCRVLRSLKKVCIAGHVSPDADAVGSVCGLALGLSSLGIHAEVYFQDTVPERMSSLVGDQEILSVAPEDAFDAVITVDTASAERLGESSSAFLACGKQVLNIDHHASNTCYGDLNYIVSESSSSAEIVLCILQELKVRLTPSIANLLYAGLLEDTGAFRFSNTNAGSFAHAAELLRHGAEPAKVGTELYFSAPKSAQKLRGLAIAGLEFALEERVAMISVPKDMLEAAGARLDETEGLIDEARRIQGVLVAVLIREIETGWKISLRSKDESVDVNAIASIFGGGGHVAAAGCTMSGSLESIKEQLFACIQERLSQ